MSYLYEYETLEILSGDKARYIRVPLEIIEDRDMLSIRVSLFVYLSIYKGLNNHICFSIPLFLAWAGYKNNGHTGGINDKVIGTLSYLSDLGYVVFGGNTDLSNISRRACIELIFNTQLVHDNCSEKRFAILYLDEIARIMSFSRTDSKDRFLNRNTVLLVFAFLRQAIFRMPNTLKPEERSKEGIEARRKKYAEAYNDTYKDIGLALGLTKRTTSLAVKVLEELKLIVTAEAYHIKNEGGEFRTPDTIFANMEKREGNKLLAGGLDYANDEIRRKAEIIHKYNEMYYIKNSNRILGGKR